MTKADPSQIILRLIPDQGQNQEIGIVLRRDGSFEVGTPIITDNETLVIGVKLSSKSLAAISDFRYSKSVGLKNEVDQRQRCLASEESAKLERKKKEIEQLKMYSAAQANKDYPVYLKTEESGKQGHAIPILNCRLYKKVQAVLYGEFKPNNSDERAYQEEILRLHNLAQKQEGQPSLASSSTSSSTHYSSNNRAAMFRAQEVQNGDGISEARSKQNNSARASAVSDYDSTSSLSSGSSSSDTATTTVCASASVARSFAPASSSSP